jgi:hypothetical protein
MNKKLLLLVCSIAFSGILSSCYTAPYDGGYVNGGDFPRNGAEALVPIVVGAAIIGALASSHHGGHYSHNSYSHGCHY